MGVEDADGLHEGEHGGGSHEANPRRRNSLDRARDSADVVGISATVRGRGVVFGLNDQMGSARPTWSRNRIVARALVIAASIFWRLHTIPASASRRSMPSSVYCATVSGWKPSNAVRNAGRLRGMVAQDSPAKTCRKPSEGSGLRHEGRNAMQSSPTKVKALSKLQQA